ncbi:MAG: CsgG/HfaB family protein [Chitinivibrionales bacterium]|nr:CsgG/HfaB family protein [Chitinivibrionales bacterium]
MNKKLMPLLFILSFSLTLYGAETIAMNRLSASGGVTADEAASLTDALRSELVHSKLVKIGYYQIMERSQMDEILKEQGFQQSGACDETGCAVEMGKLLSVKYILLGNVGKVGQTYTMNLRLVEVQTGKIKKDITELHKGSSDELLTKIMPIVAEKIMGTYTAPKSKSWLWWAAGGVVVAVAVPVAYFDGITAECVLESILNANGITKTIRSTSPVAGKHEKLYIIESFTYDGLLIYTKGAIKKDADGEHFYLLVSSKNSVGT